jgi:hypothetical protein
MPCAARNQYFPLPLLFFIGINPIRQLELSYLFSRFNELSSHHPLLPTTATMRKVPMARKSSGDCIILVMMFFLSLIMLIVYTLSEPNIIELSTLLN